MLSASRVFPTILAMIHVVYHPTGADSNIWLTVEGRVDAGDDGELMRSCHYLEMT